MDQIVDLLIGGTGLGLTELGLLLGVSFLGSFMTVALGIGGGMLVMAVMAQVLPPAALVPIHGAVQIGSNFGRMILMRKYIHSGVLPAFTIGALLGGLIGAELVFTLPVYLLQAILGLFIIYATWAPKIAASNPGKRTFFGLGLGATLATMFVGATGSLVAPFMNAACKERQRYVATHATAMTIQHGFKIIAFGTLGFAFGPYVPLLAGLIGFGFAGTWVGRHVLLKVPEKIFRMGLKMILTVLALRLLHDSTQSYFGLISLQ